MSAQFKISLGRRYRFFAAHRLYNPDFSDAENARIFGKCNHPNGHGHTYNVDVVVSGCPDPVTRMIMNLEDLDRAAGQVIDQLAYKQIERDIPAFAGKISTTENVVTFIYDQLLPLLAPFGVTLERVEVGETRNNRFEAERRAA